MEIRIMTVLFICSCMAPYSLLDFIKMKLIVDLLLVGAPLHSVFTQFIEESILSLRVTA